MSNEKAAVLKMQLKAKSGYQSKEEHKISLNQWIRIQEILSCTEWKQFSEKPENENEIVLVQESDGSVGLWQYSKAVNFSGVEKLMWCRTPRPYEPPMNFITKPFITTP